MIHLELLYGYHWDLMKIELNEYLLIVTIYEWFWGYKVKYSINTFFIVSGKNENSQNRSVKFIFNYRTIIRYSVIWNSVPKTWVLWNLFDLLVTLRCRITLRDFLYQRSKYTQRECQSRSQQIYFKQTWNIFVQR